MLEYLFWPNPPAPAYSDPKVTFIIVVCAGLVVCSFMLKRWRKKQHNPISRKLTRAWPSAALWFGLTGLFITICRVEGISYVSMRFWWLVWAIAFVLFALFQCKMYRSRHYEVVRPEKREEDPMEKYLPKKKR